jgi:hypothetical protein
MTLTPQDTIERQAATAGIILQQLGGQRFRVMTGAKHFKVRNAKLGGLFFRLPARQGYVLNGINAVEIVLEHNDTYTVEFLRFRGVMLAPVVVHALDGVYAEDLQEIFTHYTGLYTSL